jgi:hypothetical protein
MSDKDEAGARARTWIECWSRGVPDEIPLAGEFKHTSPFGCVQGREKYLDWVKPLAAKNVTELSIIRILSRGNEAAIHFEMQTPKGRVHVCDWVVVKSGEISEIHSFYDATGLRDSA